MVVRSLNKCARATAKCGARPQRKRLEFVGGLAVRPEPTVRADSAGQSFNRFQCDAVNTAELLRGTASPWRAQAAPRNDDRAQARRKPDRGSGTSLAEGDDTGGSSGSSFLALSTPPPGCARWTGGAEHRENPTTRRLHSYRDRLRFPDAQREQSYRPAPPDLPPNCGGAEFDPSASEVLQRQNHHSAANPTGRIVGDNVTVTARAGTTASRVTAVSQWHHVQYTAAARLGRGNRWLRLSRAAQ